MPWTSEDGTAMLTVGFHDAELTFVPLLTVNAVRDTFRLCALVEYQMVAAGRGRSTKRSWAPERTPPAGSSSPASRTAGPRPARRSPAWITPAPTWLTPALSPVAPP